MFKTRLTALVLSGCVLGALLAVSGVGEAAPQLQSFSCYPANEYVITSGPTDAFGAGFGHFRDGKIEIPPNPDIEKKRGRIKWSFHAGIFGDNTSSDNGYMVGGLIVWITWEDGSPDTIFKSGCVAEIQGEAADGEFEGEFEGIIENFPGLTGPRVGIATFTVSKEPDGKPSGRFSAELGTTCNQVLTDGQETEMSLSWKGRVAGDVFFKVTNTAGRWAFPVGKAPADCPFESLDD